MATRTYSPSDINILLAGFYQMGGFVSGSFISISKDVQPFKTTRTIDGQVARTHTKDNTYTITLTLASTSPDNDILTKIFQADELTRFAKFPMFIKDLQGSSLFLAPTCWIKEVPDLTYADDITDRVWVIQATEAIPNFGGNEDASSALQDLANVVVGGVSLF